MTSKFRKPLPGGPMRRSLFWRVAITNGVIFSAAVAGLAISPATVSFPLAPGEALILVAGTCAVVALNVVALRRAFVPLTVMVNRMSRFDPLCPDVAPAGGHHCTEVAAITDGFDQMVHRLEEERRDSAARVLRAEEREHQRLTRELHDEVGQTLTVLLLQLVHVARVAAPETRERLAAAQETARDALREVRRIGERLRPEALDDLGLESALVALADRVSGATDFTVDSEIEGELPQLDEEASLAVFRIAQEGLTNAVRHSEGRHVNLRCARSAHGLTLCITDDGRGMVPDAVPGSGIRGMRERALTVGGRLTVHAPEGGGAEVRFDLPAVKVPA